MNRSPAIYGLVLAGGASTRMRRDKAALAYEGKPQLLRAFELLNAVCTKTFVSVRADQTNEPTRAGLPQIVDRLEGYGPIAGIHAAQSLHPEVAWLILACDLPFLNRDTLDQLLAQRDPERFASAYRSSHDGLPEPLCAVFEPRSVPAMAKYIEDGGRCPRKFLAGTDVRLLDQPDPRALDNINTAEEYDAAVRSLEPQQGRTAVTHRIRIKYHAVLREQARCSGELVDTAATTPAALYEELRLRHSFGLERERLRVAVNAEFAQWTAPLQDGDEVVFIPPVAGG